MVLNTNVLWFWLQIFWTFRQNIFSPYWIHQSFLTFSETSFRSIKLMIHLLPRVKPNCFKQILVYFCLTKFLLTLCWEWNQSINISLTLLPLSSLCHVKYYLGDKKISLFQFILKWKKNFDRSVGQDRNVAQSAPHPKKRIHMIRDKFALTQMYT